MENRAVGYARVSTQEQASSGLGLEAQRSDIDRSNEYRRRELVEMFVDEGVSAKTMDRPALARALDYLDAGMADVLVVAKLDRLTRSMADLMPFLDRVAAASWDLVILDIDVDTTTDSGRLIVSVMGSVAEFERRQVSTRTKAALAAKKARGEKLGRPHGAGNEQSPEDLARVAELHAAGGSLRSIAAVMTEEGRKTSRGGQWHPTTVARALKAIAHQPVDVAA